MFVLSIKYVFSVQQYTNYRVKFQHKICFRPSIVALKKKTTPTIAIATRLMKDGEFLKLYKNCNKFFINYILPNVYFLPPNNEFKNLFFQYLSFTDFNRVLFWRIMSINALFNLKKLKNKKLLYYLKTERRVSTVLLWLKQFIKLSKTNYHNNNIELFRPLSKFIFVNKQHNQIYHIKLRIYRLRLLRG